MERRASHSNESLTTGEAAERLGVSSDQIMRWIESGRLPAERRHGAGGDEFRIPASALEQIRGGSGQARQLRSRENDGRGRRTVGGALLIGGVAAAIAVIVVFVAFPGGTQQDVAPTAVRAVDLAPPATIDSVEERESSDEANDDAPADREPELEIVPLPEFDAAELIFGGSGVDGANLAGPGIVSAVANPTRWSVLIPAARIRADVVGLGNTAEGALGAPDSPDVVGWWRDGPEPGERGNVLFAGHRDFTDIDGNVGTGVAWELPNVEVGDSILVVDHEAQVTFVYTVRETLTVAYNDPDVGRFLRSSSAAMVTLITCEGSFDGDARRYSSRRIVIAELIGKAEEIAA